MPGVLRIGQDVGLLTNVRMAVEIGVGLAHLSDRRLSIPFDTPIPPAPVSPIADSEKGQPSRVVDLLELPLAVVPPEEWSELDQAAAEVHDWDTIGHGVCLVDGPADLDDPVLRDFLNGRKRVWTTPASPAEIVRIEGRLLSFYSYFFFASGPSRRNLHAILRGVRPRRPYRELGARIARGLGRYNAVHIRRSDLTIGIPAYDSVTPEQIAANVSGLLPADDRLLVCTEMEGSDELFDPLRARFADIVFANDLILGEHRHEFFDLPRHEDNALGLITQEIAKHADRFVGTMGSTFTAMIQRQRLLDDPTSRFVYTADFTPDGPTFDRGEFRDIRDGAFSWNRIALNMSPDVLAWFREWPEAA